MSRIHKRGTAELHANLTPMIDVTFLLIVFFVLVSQIVEVENVELKLPELEETAHRDVLALVEQGRYRSTPTRVVALSEVPEALRDLRERRTLGRVVARL